MLLPVLSLSLSLSLSPSDYPIHELSVHDQVLRGGGGGAEGPAQEFLDYTTNNLLRECTSRPECISPPHTFPRWKLYGYVHMSCSFTRARPDDVPFWSGGNPSEQKDVQFKGRPAPTFGTWVVNSSQGSVHKILDTFISPSHDAEF